MPRRRSTQPTSLRWGNGISDSTSDFMISPTSFSPINPTMPPSQTLPTPTTAATCTTPSRTCTTPSIVSSARTGTWPTSLSRGLIQYSGCIIRTLIGYLRFGKPYTQIRIRRRKTISRARLRMRREGRRISIPVSLPLARLQYPMP